jgi:acyl carrier protein
VNKEFGAMEGYYPVGMERLSAILKRVRPSFNEVLSHSDVIGQEMGFSSIEQVRIIAQIETALDIDLADEGVETLSVGILCKLLETV